MELDQVIRHAMKTLRSSGRDMNDLSDALGVPLDVREGVRSHGPLGALLGVLPIHSHGTHFDIAEGDSLAAILAAYRRPDDLPIDLVAVSLDEPKNALRLLGVAHALGEPEIDRARFRSCPLLKAEPGQIVVHASALDWLRSGCEGCAILESERVPSVLADIDQCVVTADYAPTFYKLLHQCPPHIPTIMVPRESLAA